MDEDYPDFPDVEVLLDGRPLPRELWRRYAVSLRDLQAAADSGMRTVYGCSGTVTVQSTRPGAGLVQYPVGCGC